MGIKVNFTNVQDLSEPIPIGLYVLAVTGITPGEGAKGPYISWEFTVQEGEHAGRKLWSNTSFSEASIWRLKQLLEALQGKKLPKEEIDIVPEQYLGLKALAQVAITNGQDDQPKNEIKKFTPYAQTATGAATVAPGATEKPKRTL